MPLPVQALQDSSRLTSISLLQAHNSVGFRGELAPTRTRGQLFSSMYTGMQQYCAAEGDMPDRAVKSWRAAPQSKFLL